MKFQYSINGFSKGKLRNPQIILISTPAILLLSFFPFYYCPSLLVCVQNSSQSVSFPPSSPQLLSPPPPPLPSLLPSPPPQLLFPPPLSSSIPPQTTNVSLKEECDVTRGKWIRDPHAPYYTNTTCWTIQEHQNCMKYGRPNMEFLKWRWKPEGCELPLFNPEEFLRIVRGKSMAFVGDSLSRNQMQSLMCLLSRVEYPKDVSETTDENFKRMYYESYDFNISIFWSPFLVRAEEPEGGEGLLEFSLRNSVEQLATITFTGV